MTKLSFLPQKSCASLEFLIWLDESLTVDDVLVTKSSFLLHSLHTAVLDGNGLTTRVLRPHKAVSQYSLFPSPPGNVFETFLEIMLGLWVAGFPWCEASVSKMKLGSFCIKPQNSEMLIDRTDYKNFTL